jgi:hypothetical protein
MTMAEQGAEKRFTFIIEDNRGIVVVATLAAIADAAGSNDYCHSA